MKIAVGSTNPVKIKAVEIAFRLAFPHLPIIVRGIAVKSGVSSQPMSDTESIRGATARAKLAVKKVKADYGVGLEGGLQKIGENWFDCGWVVVIDQKGVSGIGSSLRMLVPQRLMTQIKRGLELGDALDLVWQRKNIKKQEGHFGIMTNRLVTRKSGYRDGVISALVRFLKPELFLNSPNN